MPTLADFVRALFILIIGAGVFAVLFWLLAALPIPNPFALVLKYALYVGAAGFVISVLLNLAGYPILRNR